MRTRLPRAVVQHGSGEAGRIDTCGLKRTRASRKLDIGCCQTASSARRGGRVSQGVYASRCAAAPADSEHGRSVDDPSQATAILDPRVRGRRLRAGDPWLRELERTADRSLRPAYSHLARPSTRSCHNAAATCTRRNGRAAAGNDRHRAGGDNHTTTASRNNDSAPGRHDDTTTAAAEYRPPHGQLAGAARLSGCGRTRHAGSRHHDAASLGATEYVFGDRDTERRRAAAATALVAGC